MSWNRTSVILSLVDIQVHGRFAHATSEFATIKEYDAQAKQKGIKILGTGDALHEEWLKEIKENLKPIGDTGLFEGKYTTFMLTTEVNCEFLRNNTLRTIHVMMSVPRIEDIQDIRYVLSKYSTDLDRDGRPTVNLSCESLVKLVLDKVSETIFIPAHVWTPHFSLYSANRGFDTIKDCFGEASKHIFCIETGLSSDPELCSYVKDTEGLTLISSSDAHSASLGRLGRETFIIKSKEQYTFKDIWNTVKTRNNDFLGTIEVPPELGKYHYAGHRNCGISYNIEEYNKRNGFCMKCGKKVTMGVEKRIHDLSKGYKYECQQKYMTLIPLVDLLLAFQSKQAMAKHMQRLIQVAGSEIEVLTKLDAHTIEENSSDKVADVIIKARRGELQIEAGFDGTYGKIKVGNGIKDPVIKIKDIGEMFG